MIPWFSAAALVLIGVGLYIGFFVAPTDFQQGDAYRIIFVHVPAAWMSMFLYVIMAVWAGLGLGVECAPFVHDGAGHRPHRGDVYVSGAAHRCRCGANRPGVRGGCGMPG